MQRDNRARYLLQLSFIINCPEPGVRFILTSERIYVRDMLRFVASITSRVAGACAIIITDLSFAFLSLTPRSLYKWESVLSFFYPRYHHNALISPYPLSYSNMALHSNGIAYTINPKLKLNDASYLSKLGVNHHLRCPRTSLFLFQVFCRNM